MKKTIKLSSGHIMPIIGLGTWQSDPGKVGAAVEYALLEAGYNHIDCASVYGNQKEVGKSLTKVWQTRKRESVFITSKLWNTDHKESDVEKACKKTLSDLKLEYLDLYLIHWGIAQKSVIPKIFPNAKVPIQETWGAMENLVKKGLVKSIGVANFSGMMLADIATYANIMPAINQIELHPYLAQSDLVQYCQNNNIAVTAYSPLGRQGVKDIAPPRLFDEQIVLSLAKKYDKTPAQILLNWGICRGTIVIPKSVTPSRILENINVFDFELDKKEVEAITELDCNRRFVDPSNWWNVPCFN